MQLYKTDLQEVSGSIPIKLKKLDSGQIVIFKANVFRPRPPSKMPPVRLWSSLLAETKQCWEPKRRPLTQQEFPVDQVHRTNC